MSRYTQDHPWVDESVEVEVERRSTKESKSRGVKATLKMKVKVKVKVKVKFKYIGRIRFAILSYLNRQKFLIDKKK